MKEKISEMTAEQIIKELKRKKNFSKAQTLAGFFKTKKGDYGYGDIFWGITVPEIRKVTEIFSPRLSFLEVEKLLDNPVHEIRLAGLICLVKKYQKGNIQEKKEIVKSYRKKIDKVNNWDLVDLSAPKILGDYFFSRDKKFLYQLAGSKKLWRRRIAIVTTWEFIRRNSFADTLHIAELFLSDKEDLIAKATGWMLREVGKRDKKLLKNFLKKNKEKMAPVTWRYATEKFSLKEKKKISKLF